MKASCPAGQKSWRYEIRLYLESVPYDNEGNLVGETNTSSHVVTTYTYDDRNRLTLVTVGGTIEATYTYDALNRRIGANDNGTQTWTVYNAQNPYADFARGGSGGTVLTERYLYGPGANAILARTSSGGSSAWYLTDNAGSVRDVASIGISSVTVLDHIVYDSFGNVTSESSPSNGDRFKFQSMQYDSTVGLYYDNARWYNPLTGKFVSLDPKVFAASDMNLYRFVGNRPTDSTDPSGLNTLDLLMSNNQTTTQAAMLATQVAAAVRAGMTLATAISLNPAARLILAGGGAGIVAGAALYLAFMAYQQYQAAQEAAALKASLAANLKKVSAIKVYVAQLIIMNQTFQEQLENAMAAVARAQIKVLSLQYKLNKSPQDEAAYAAALLALETARNILKTLGGGNP